MILDLWKKSYIRSALKGWDKERDQAFKEKKITGIISLGEKKNPKPFCLLFHLKSNKQKTPQQENSFK